MVLCISFAALVLGTLFLFLTEWGNEAYAGKALNKQILASLFQSVTCRTAGFNTIDLAKLTEAGIFVMICLMFIGGSTGSTAGGIKTTTDLKEVIERALKFLPVKEQKEAVKKACARTFQALRIDVNSEFEVLYAFLEKLPEVLAPNGRVAILTFHSGEDRLVKRSFKELHKAGIYSDISRDVIRPSAEECARNSRAKSTKMRWAIRSEE